MLHRHGHEAQQTERGDDHREDLKTTFSLERIPGDESPNLDLVWNESDPEEGDSRFSLEL